MGRSKQRPIVVKPCPINGCSGRLDASSFTGLRRHFANKHPELQTTSYAWPPRGGEGVESMCAEVAGHEEESFDHLNAEPEAADPGDEESATGENCGADDGVEAEYERLYCYCREAYNPKRAMIACDGCDEWFHSSCLGMTDYDFLAIDTYFCAECQERDRYLFVRFKDQAKKPCANLHCGQHAGENSKYCSHKCGLVQALALARAAIPLARRSSSAMEEMAAADGSQLHRLREIKALKQDISRMIQDLENQESVLQLRLADADTTPVVEPSTEKPQTIKMDAIDCPVCGLAATSHHFPRHVAACTIKVEELQVPESHYSGPKYAKLRQELCQDPGRNGVQCLYPAICCPLHGHARKFRSRDEKPVACGFRLSADQSMCRMPRSQCHRHYGWDTATRTRLVLTKLHKMSQLFDIEDEETRLKISFGARHNPYNALFHKTTSHDRECGIT